jgi:hypothetical protein
MSQKICNRSIKCSLAESFVSNRRCDRPVCLSAAGQLAPQDCLAAVGITSRLTAVSPPTHGRMELSLLLEKSSMSSQTLSA